MKHWRVAISCVLCLTLVEAAHAQRAPMEFWLPLTGEYHICLQDSGFVLAKASRWSCIEILLEGVEAYAVRDAYIVGKSSAGYFVLDTNGPLSEPLTFASREAWGDFLARAGLPRTVALKSPEETAATMPAVVLRPWNYVVMGNALGLPDQLWAFLVVLLGALLSFAWGISIRRWVVAYGVYLGLVVYWLAIQGIALGADHATILAAVYLPAAYVLLGACGRRLAARRTKGS